MATSSDKRLAIYFIKRPHHSWLVPFLEGCPLHLQTLPINRSAACFTTSSETMWLHTGHVDLNSAWAPPLTTVCLRRPVCYVLPGHVNPVTRTPIEFSFVVCKGRHHVCCILLSRKCLLLSVLADWQQRIVGVSFRCPSFHHPTKDRLCRVPEGGQGGLQLSPSCICSSRL